RHFRTPGADFPSAGARGGIRTPVRRRTGPDLQQASAAGAVPTPHAIRRLVAALLEWFQGSARDLPWRRTLDPYAIWVSEIMLQQTQVKTVIPYWERWMAALPDVRALATARPERVLKLWEGLGYYARARNLQKAAQQIVERHGGLFPRDFDDILKLPGVGRYTAGAIGSIAFNQPVPILDGNVIRVLTRIFHVTGDPRSKAVNRQLWALAEALVREAATRPFASPQAAAGPCSALNQSLMELGATVCIARVPACPACPVQSHCAARREGVAERLPHRRKPATVTARRFAAFLVARNGRFLVRQRPANGVNAGLWEFPNLELISTRRTARLAFEELFGRRPARLVRVGRLKHSITRYRMTLEVYSAPADPAQLAAPGGRWVRAADLAKLAFAAAHRRIVDGIATAARRKGTAPAPGAWERERP
ncbi:MAG TPA: A/G-specific adenine glycosylase, partial [Methylomirabilota bacterium]|nr:A/G-specific adenine glycosylase [Methylomirabilota bacterium]